MANKRMANKRMADETVADELLKLILVGDLSAGVELPSVADLGVTFGVSRDAVREALAVLADRDLITTGGRPRVAVVSLEDAGAFVEMMIGMLSSSGALRDEELYESRELLLVASARSASSCRTGDQVESLREIVDRQSHRRGGGNEYAHHLAFHRIVFEASGNVLLRLMAEPLFRIVERRLGEADIPPVFWAGTIDGHRAILDAIVARDADDAAEAMRRHLLQLQGPFHGGDL